MCLYCMASEGTLLELASPRDDAQRKPIETEPALDDPGYVEVRMTYNLPGGIKANSAHTDSEI